MKISCFYDTFVLLSPWEVKDLNIGKKIHDRRIQLGLTLEQVGDYCGVGKSTVRKWETGQIANMRRDKIAQLANILNISPVELIDTPAMSVRDINADRLEALHKNPRLGLLFDRQRNMSPEDVEFMLQMADRILKERDHD